MSVANGEQGGASGSAPRSVPPREPQGAEPPELTGLALVLRVALSRKGWTMAELARQIGASRSAVTKWFAGESKPDSRHIPALSRHLGVPQLELWRFYMEYPVDVMPPLTEQRFSDVLAIPAGISDEALAEAVADIQSHWPVFCARREQERANRRARAAVQEAILGAVVEDQSHRRQQAIEAAESPPADTPESPPPPPPDDHP